MFPSGDNEASKGQITKKNIQKSPFNKRLKGTGLAYGNFCHSVVVH
jgi:hypothetical protein